MLTTGLSTWRRHHHQAITLAATANAALHIGATARSQMSIQPRVRSKHRMSGLIKERPRAVVAVGYTGHPADYGAVREITSRRGIAV